MNGRKGCELTEAQQLLLCRFFDQECSCLGRFRARRLLNCNAEAKQYIDALTKAGISCREAMELAQLPAADLWKRIVARIDSEERAALYLGKRPVAVDQGSDASLWTRFSGSQVLFGGLSGAAVTAVALFIATGVPDATEYPSVARGPAQPGTAGFTQVGTDGGPTDRRSKSRPVLMSNRNAATALEVDWMRANGPLRFIQNPGERSAIIWVTKRNRSEPFPKRSSLEATPTVPVGLSQSVDESVLSRQR